MTSALDIEIAELLGWKWVSMFPEKEYAEWLQPRVQNSKMIVPPNFEMRIEPISGVEGGVTYYEVDPPQKPRRQPYVVEYSVDICESIGFIRNRWPEADIVLARDAALVCIGRRYWDTTQQVGTLHMRTAPPQTDAERLACLIADMLRMEKNGYDLSVVPTL